MEAAVHGIFPIVYTPYDAAGRLDREDLGRLVDYLIAAGAHGLAAVGGASECHKMSVPERKSLAELTIAAARGRVPVLVGTSAVSIADSVELTRHAGEAGAVGVFCTPPLSGPVTRDAVLLLYRQLASVVDGPVLIQDANVTVPISLIAELGREKANLRWVKEEAVDSGHRITELRATSDAGISIMSGGSYLLDDLARGAIGAIPGSIGVADLARAYDRYVAGDLVGARAAFDHFLPLSYWRRQFPLLAAKEVLRRAGVFKAAHLREPSSERLDAQDHRELDAILEKMGPPF
jgi:4-hydroxy-tetrahydrodipicolinate synthase